MEERMDESINAPYFEVAQLKKILLENNNIEILLYLARYNPDVPRATIVDKFGKESINGLEDLKKARLITEKTEGISLTQEGIFQVDGLLSIRV